MQLADVAKTHRRVASEPGRDRKVDLLAEVLERADSEEVPVLFGLLSGQPRQGRLGIGPATLRHALDQVAEPRQAGQLDGLSGEGDEGIDVMAFDEALTELAGMGGPGSAGRRRRALTALLEKVSAGERDFIARLLLGDLRQGAGEALLLEAAIRVSGADDADVRRDALRLGSPSAAAVHQLSASGDDPVDATLRLFRPVSPMLASAAADAATAAAAMERSLLEVKVDGARVQLHRRAEEVRVYTRKLNDITAAVPEIVAGAAALGGGDLVLDGEVVAWADEGPLPFQQTMRRVGSSGASEADLAALPLRAFWFDCLYADEDLLDRPLEERRVHLEAVTTPRQRPFSRRLEGGDPAIVDGFLAEAREDGFEGIMIKDLDAPYRAGRRGKAWLKLKPVQTLDLVVLAAEWGSGRRRGWLSNLHLGARGESREGFVMLGKTFKGMTDELLAWQTETLLGLETHREGNVVHVHPERVVEIAFEGVQRSSRYPGGVSLRFARLRQYRTDKGPSDVDSIEAVRALLPEGPGVPPEGSAPTAQGDLFDGL